jgi:hypothetical protein
VKYENYGLIQENWNRFVIREQSARALLESLTDEQIYKMLNENKKTYFDTVGQPRGAIEKTTDAVGNVVKRLRNRVVQGAGLTAVTDIMADLPVMGIDIDLLLSSPYGVAVITVAIMNQFNISKKQAVKAAQDAAQTAKEKGPDAAKQAAAATSNAARVAGQKTIEHINRISKDSRASPGVKKFFGNVAAILKPEELEDEATIQKRLKQITDKTAGPVNPSQDDDVVIEPEYEVVDGEPEPT